MIRKAWQTVVGRAVLPNFLYRHLVLIITHTFKFSFQTCWLLSFDTRWHEDVGHSFLV